MLRKKTNTQLNCHQTEKNKNSMNNKRTDITYRISHKSQENRFFYFSQKTLQVE